MGAIVGGVVGGFVFLLFIILIIMIIVIYFVYKRRTHNLHLLPDEISWSYLEQENGVGDWSFQGARNASDNVTKKQGIFNFIFSLVYLRIF